MSVEKLKIFFSHRSAESKVVDHLSTNLKKDFIGLVELFISCDRVSVPVGSKWLEEITNGLKRSGLHIVLCSPDAVTRPWINFEAGAAHVRGVNIIPLCHLGINASQLPVPLSEYQGLEISTPEGLQSLYASVAQMLGASLPTVPFRQYAEEIKALDNEYLREQQTLRTVVSSAPPAEGVEYLKNPNVLCITSSQFMKIGYENQVEKVINAFPPSVEHARVLDSMTVRTELRQKSYHIVHIAAFICPRTGDLFFSDVDLQSGLPSDDRNDRMGADELSALLATSGTKLVVITGCDCVVVVPTLTQTAHVVAARDIVSANMMALWVEVFYKMLTQGGQLSQALDYAIKASNAPMRFYARQQKFIDLELQMSGLIPKATATV